MTYLITLFQLEKLEELIKDAVDEATRNGAGATDDFEHLYEQQFSLGEWILTNLKDVK